MSVNIKCKDKIIQDIELILVDICGTMFDFDNLWLKQIGYIAQNLAETHATFRGELFRIRAMLIKALGVDPEAGQIDYTGAYLSCSDEEIKAVLSSILYLNNVEWLEAVKSVEKIIIRMLEDIDPKDFVKIYPDTKDFTKQFSQKVRIIPYSLKTFVKNQLILMQYNDLENIENWCSLDKMDIGATKYSKTEIVNYYCSKFDIKPENILVLADSLGDFPLDSKINKVFVNRSLLEKEFLDNISFDYIVTNLVELEVFK